MSQIVFTVYITPRPQGSMKGHIHGGHVKLTSDNTHLKAYRKVVGLEAVIAANQQEFDMIGKHVPVGMVLQFFLARPESAPKSRKAPSVKPDIDKLTRAVFDALSGILYNDDGQVVETMAYKYYAETPDLERVEISLYTV